MRNHLRRPVYDLVCEKNLVSVFFHSSPMLLQHGKNVLIVNLQAMFAETSLACEIILCFSSSLKNPTTGLIIYSFQIRSDPWYLASNLQELQENIMSRPASLTPPEKTETFSFDDT